MRVYQTSKYNEFGLIESNRPINYKKIDKMRESIKQKNLSRAYPIVVNSKSASKKRYGLDGNTFAIIDGQHRFTSLSLEGQKIFYNINDEIDLRDIPKAAALQDSWKLTDYIHSYAVIRNGMSDNGNQRQYRALKGYMEGNKFPPSSTLVILCGSRDGHVLNQVRTGELQIIRDWKESNEIANNIDDMSRYIPFARNARFIEAYVEAYDNPEFDHNHMMNKLDYLGSKFRRCASSSDFLEQIEFIYNYKSRNPVKFIK